ncbi:MAG: tRNA (guanosine(37)-N1)-methyltransferase TrmD [Candidatus Omnitrophota bacterium]
MRIDVITIFPGMFASVLGESIIKRAQEKGLVKIAAHNLRNNSRDKHKKVDDRPYGGGPGMVMCPGPIFRAVEMLRRKINVAGRSGAGKRQNTRVILLTPQGKTLTQGIVRRLAKYRHIILICGRYEGVDERVSKYLVNEELSIGDYVLSGGELAAMVVIDCVVRLIPGVLGKLESRTVETFEQNMVEYPQYTRPEVFKGRRVPVVLLSGDHRRIEQWRREQSLKATCQKRPDLLIA